MFVAQSVKGLWVSVEIERSGITFQLPGPEKPDVLKQFLECELNALNNLEDSLKNE
jgi:hypothetical protein